MSKIFIFLCKNNIHLFLLTLHFHIALVCICSVFIESLILCIILGYCGALFILILPITWCLVGLGKEKDERQQWLEATWLSFLTQTNLRDTRTDKIVRMVLCYTSLIFYCGMVMTIVIICNVNPDNVVIDDGLGHDVVRDLALVQNIITLNIVCGVAMGCLLVSWILDILCQNESDNGGDYHSAWKEILKMFGMQKLTQINLIKK